MEHFCLVSVNFYILSYVFLSYTLSMVSCVLVVVSMGELSPVLLGLEHCVDLDSAQDLAVEAECFALWPAMSGKLHIYGPPELIFRCS